MKNQVDPKELETAIEDVHRAGMPGVFAEVRDGAWEQFEQLP
jgi:D-alanyl-D-alanine carboxypeptidase